MIDSKLEQLKRNGAIVDYSYVNVNDSGIEGEESYSRNTEKLILKFPNGESLTIDTVCSGSYENTTMFFR